MNKYVYLCCIFIRLVDDKIKRHTDIRKIIAVQQIHSQNDLLEILVSRGHNVTQATLSRDLKQLKASKIPGDKGSYKYVINDGPIEKKNLVNYDGYTMSGFLSIEFSGNLGIIKTKPALSGAIASAIDNAAIREVLGTIAGDDTLLIISREGFSKHDVVRALKNKFPVLKEIIR